LRPSWHFWSVSAFSSALGAPSPPSVPGAACIIVALAPPVASHDDNFTVHVVQHLLLGMVGPLLVALGAPPRCS